jgi:hypothetical protein
MRYPAWFLLAGMILPAGGMSGCSEPKATPTASTVPEVAKPEPPPPVDPRIQKRADRTEQIRKLETLAESLRSEITVMERQIELLEKVNNPSDNNTRHTLLLKRLVESEAETEQLNKAIPKLESEIATIKKLLAGKESPTPAEVVVQGKLQTLLRELETLLVLKKENRQKLETERDALKKLLAACVEGDLNIQTMKDALKPQREQLKKIEGYLTQLRAEQQDE